MEGELLLAVLGAVLTAVGALIKTYKLDAKVAELDRLRQRGTRLDELRADVIKQLYAKMYGFLAAAESFAAIAEYSGDGSKEDKGKRLGAAAGDFYEYFRLNSIYFPENIVARIEHLYAITSDPCQKFAFFLSLKNQSPTMHRQIEDAWNEAYKTISEQVPPLMTEIQHEFRQLLGVETSLSAPAPHAGPVGKFRQWFLCIFSKTKIKTANS